MLWWIGTVLGAPIFWPLFSDRLVACRSERSQCRSGTSRPVQGFDYSIIRRGRDRRDETRQDKTPVCCAVLDDAEGTVPDGKGEERSGAAGSRKEWWDGG